MRNVDVVEMRRAAGAAVNADKHSDGRAYRHAAKRMKKLAKREREAYYRNAA